MTLADLEACLSEPLPTRRPYERHGPAPAELIVRTIAQTALDNETYFCELDAVAGDGDFGYSLARGFENVLEDWDELEYDDVGGLLKKTAIVLTKRIGGTSGPIWGTAFLRAAARSRASRSRAARTSSRRCARRSKASSSAATPTSATRRCSTRSSRRSTSSRRRSAKAPRRRSSARRPRRGESAEATKGMLAQRGRASYTGERSRDSVDAGAIGVAMMFEAVSRRGGSRSWNGPDGPAVAAGNPRREETT